MNSDEYQKVKEIFHSVLDLTVEERSVYLAENCSLDPTIRHEVERLLRTYQPSYLEQPAIAQFAASADTDGLVCGQRIGHFTIVEKIGAGGMGEVYLAEDEKLGRQVAIKLLPKTFTDDTDWLIRFEQEARTASALNHPNIITVFEIGEADRTRYIATEYIDGVTLRAKLNRGKLSVHEALDIAIQCASALATAHENGIIHRDIKPENIMLRRDNLVKVLDFGLAKLVEKSEPVSHDAPTEKHIKTAPGVIMGTVQYMSPEQTRGHATDARTDIWSLGVVIYEMVAGRPPFAADNSADLIAEIVRTRVEPLSRYEHEIPEQLEEIVDKALSKDPDDRYQTVRDLSVDLKRLNRRLDTEFASDLSNEDLLTVSDLSISAPNIISTRKGPKDLTTVSSAEYLIWGIKAHRLTAFGITLFVLSLLGGTAWLVRHYWREPEKKSLPFESYEMTRFTTSGKSGTPAISPDGKLVAFVVTDGPLHSLLVRQIATGSEVVLLPPKKIDYFGGVTFSPTSDYVFFMTVEDGLGYLYRVPTLGGSAKKLITDVDSNISFSPDGKRFAFIRHNIKSQTSSIIIANSDGSDPQPLITTNGFGSMNETAWSPVEDTLIVAVRHDTSESYDFGATHWSLATISTASKELRPFGTKAWPGLINFNWLRDGTGVLFCARKEKTGPASIWLVSYPSAVERQLTNDPDSYPAMSTVSTDDTIAVERTTNATALWSLDFKNGQVKQVRSESPDQFGRNGLQELPDGRFLVSRYESPSSNFWTVDLNWKNETRLTNERSANINPLITPDAQQIIFLSNRTGKVHIWRMNIDGSGSTQLTDSTTGEEDAFTLLPDGKTIIFTRRSAMGWQTELLRTTVDGGEPEVVYSDESTSHFAPSISKDGKYLAHWAISRDSNVTGSYILVISEILGNKVTPTGKKLSVAEIGGPLGPCPWVDVQTLVCVGSKDRSNLYSVSLNGKPAKKLTDFTEKTIVPSTLSRDGARLLFARSVANTDIYLLKDKKQ